MKVEFVLVMQHLRRFTLAGQLLVAQMAILLTVLITVALVSLAQSEASFRDTSGRRIFAIAEQLASTPLVRTEMAPGAVIAGLPVRVQDVVTQYAVESVTLAGVDGIVRVSSDPTLEGKPMAIRLGARWGTARAGPASWTTDTERMLVAQTPILSDGGEPGRGVTSAPLRSRSPCRRSSTGCGAPRPTC